MIIVEGGFDSDRLTPEFARLLGDGSELVAEAVSTGCGLIEPAHFLAHLGRVGGTILRAEFLDRHQVAPEKFVENLYLVSLEQERQPATFLKFGPEALSEQSQEMLKSFESELAERQMQRGTEALFLLVLFQHLDEKVRRVLVAVAGSEEDFDRFSQTLNRRVYGPVRKNIFDEKTGELLETAFDKSGRRALSMLREETAALGYKRSTVMHLLYALVGIENGVMQRAIQFQAVDPLREVHSHLSRQLARPGKKRVIDFQLCRVTLHESVGRTLEIAADAAQREGLPISELHIGKALLTGRPGVVTEFLASRKVDVDVLREYLTRAEAELEETTENVRLPIAQIEEELRSRILGQDHAVRQILPWIKRLRFGYPKERGPAAVLLFLGPSGTGKTQLAKELARTVYGSEDELVMLEMGQFNSRESINIFIGAPPGYVGYGEGKLTNGLRDKPESVILFDEVEKAHEDVWVALMRFLDEGWISDPAGPTRDGRHCIVVLTSNLGAETLAKRLPLDIDGATDMSPEMEEAIRDVVLPYLKRPEIYNRVDDKVVFRPFDPDTYRRLVQQQIAALPRKFMDLCETQVQVKAEVIELLAQKAMEAKQEGARCVPRIINRFAISKVIDLLTENEDAQIRKVVISKRGVDTVAEET